MTIEERRAPGATRHPFDALVEVGGALGPTFEAQAINVSEDGIQLRTAYLPEPGQPLTCRFDAGSGQSVLASGEVAWSRGGEAGGEFGVRFTDVDLESVEALKRVCGVGAAALEVNPGSKVRLHIDGLASPMRAKIKDAKPTAVTVGSDLGFLQVGRQLELEDAQSGAKRPANIDRVDVVVDPESQVPQLVVTLRYCGGSRAAASAAGRAGPPVQTASPRSGPRSSMDSVEAAGEMRGALARGLDKVRPRVARLLDQVKTTAQVLAKQRRRDEASAPRRTTAPPPGGGLYAAGRRIVRGESSGGAQDTAAAAPKTRVGGRRTAVAVVAIAALAGTLALKRAHHPSPETGAPPVAAQSAAAGPAASAAPAPPSSAQPAAPAPVAVASAAPAADTPAPAKEEQNKRVRVAPFSNGPVRHANVLRLKMDGPIESIEGAQQPAGFVVKLPGRKSLEAAAPLAARDSRIAAIKVSNDSAGAELTVAFRDGVPNYRVSARGDVLIIALAPAGLDRAVADKDDKGGRRGKHHKRSHSKTHESEQSL